MRKALVTALSQFIGQPLTKDIAISIVSQTIRYAPIDRSQFQAQQCGSLTFQAESIRDILQDLDKLSLEHWRETEFHRHGLTMDLDYEAMQAEEDQGTLIQFTARCDGHLVGNLRVYFRVSRHTKTKFAMEDTLFLLPAHRKGRNGMRFIEYAERAALQLGYREFRATTKLVNRTGALLELMKYRPVATEYVKFLEEAPSAKE